MRGFHLGEEDYTAVDGNNVRIKKSKLSLAVGDVIECLGHNVQTDTSIRQAVSTSTFTQAATNKNNWYKYARWFWDFDFL